MPTSTAPLSNGLAEAAQRFPETAHSLRAAYEARKPAASSQVTPPQLIDAMKQFLTITTNLDKEEGEVGPIFKDDVAQLGDYGLNLVADLAAWAGQIGQSQTLGALEKMALAIADWIVRHEGRIQTLEPVVNALANSANALKDRKALTALAAFMTRVLNAAADVIKQDLERSNPGRPWRVLNLNRAIVATRTHDPALMEKVFDELIQNLPQDVAMFFAQGMQQMDALNYPQPVRAVMQRYHTAWTQHSLH